MAAPRTSIASMHGPQTCFYDAAREALEHVRFQPKYDVHVRFGASYRIPFVFRIDGAAKLKDRGRRARNAAAIARSGRASCGKTSPHWLNARINLLKFLNLTGRSPI
jgi:hypothetical protein